MSEHDDLDPEDPADPADKLKDLREAAKRGEKATKELAFLRLELAATKANINAESPLAKALLATYAGEINAEALTTFFKELNADVFIKPDAADPTDPATPDPKDPVDDPTATEAERALAEARRGLAGGDAHVDPTGQDADPRITGLNAFHDAMAKGEDRRDASGAFFSEVFAAAGRGDPRVLKQ